MTIATTDIVAKGWTRQAAQSETLHHEIEQFRFAEFADEVLAGVEGEEGFALFPPAEELENLGVNLDTFLLALQNGLDPEGVNGLLEDYEVDALNDVLEQFNEYHADAEGTSALSRALRHLPL